MQKLRAAALLLLLHPASSLESRLTRAVNLDALVEEAVGGGGERAAEEHCSVPVTRDAECADAVASLSDIKSFVSRELARMTPPVEASALVSVVPTPRDAWTLSAGQGALLDLGLFFRKGCRGGLMEVRRPFDGERADECMWRADLDTLDPGARRVVREMQCVDQRNPLAAACADIEDVGEQCKAKEQGFQRECKSTVRRKRDESKEEFAKRVEECVQEEMAKCESQLHIIKGGKLPMAYRWLESVVNAMRGGARDAVAYAPNCYSKLLLLGPSAGPMLPERRAVPNGLPRRGPSRLYARDAQGACRLLTAAELGTPGYDAYSRVMAQPESHSLEWGEIVPAPPLIDAFGYQQGRGGRPGAAGVGVGGGGGTDAGAGGRPAAPGTTQALPPGGDDHGGANFPGVEKLPLYLPRKRCEICVTVLMRKIAQVPFLCHGLEYYFETCNDVVASILHWYPNVVYWSYTGGCTKKGAVGETFVRPCPPHAICSWLASPNYNQPFCPWDGQYAAPGLEDNLQADNGMDTPSDGLPPGGGNMGAPVVPAYGLVGGPTNPS